MGADGGADRPLAAHGAISLGEVHPHRLLWNWFSSNRTEFFLDCNSAASMWRTVRSFFSVRSSVSPHVIYPLLQARDPILFYDDVELYASDLDDSGAAQMSVKVRVMPTCWFALLRFWLRVDDVVLRLRETRVFCAFKDGGRGPPVVLRERQAREETFKELRARGAPAGVAQYPDAETSSQVLLAAGGPVTVTYDRLVVPA